MEYIYNKEKNTVRFYSTSPIKFHKTMGAMESFTASVFTRGGLWFNNNSGQEIDIERFIKSMCYSMKDFIFFLSILNRDQNNILSASYPSNNIENNNQEHLEIEKREDSIENSTLDIVLPKKIINKTQHSGFAADLNGMVMAAFKLTLFKDGFVIGYNMNHTLIDQASVVYYLKYLSNIYTFGYDKLTLKKPYVYDPIDSFNYERIQFKDINEAREFGATVLGFIYTPPSNNIGSSIDYFSQNSIIKLKFDLEQIDKLKSTDGKYLSKNDIICAILFKVYTLTSHLSDDQDFVLRYANNIRPRINLGDESIGNLVHQCKIELKVREVKEKSLIELARINRSSVSEIKGSDFKDDLNWAKYMYDSKEIMFDYVGKPTFITSRVTNWTNFDYDNIQFDSSKPFSIRSHCIAAYGVNTISFDTENGKKIYTCPISIPSDCVDKVIQLGNDSRLFTTDNIFI